VYSLGIDLEQLEIEEVNEEVCEAKIIWLGVEKTVALCVSYQHRITSFYVRSDFSKWYV